MRCPGAVALGLLVVASAAGAADISVVGKKLVIIDKLVIASKAKAVFVAKDLGITKGSGTDASQISGQLDVSYDSASGAFLAPQGSNWLVNKSTVAKYVNKPAPTGGSTKVTVIKPTKLLKLAARSLGDVPIDISTPPSGDVLAVYTIVNGAETNRHCTEFPTCTHKVIAGGTGYKLTCKGGALATCPSASTTTSTAPTTSTVATTSSTSTTASSTTSTSTSTTETSTTSTSTSTTETSTTSTSTSTTETSTTSTSTSTTETSSTSTSTSTSSSSTSTSTSSSTSSTTSTSTSSTTSTSSSTSTSSTSTSTSSSTSSTTSTSTSTTSSTTTSTLAGPAFPPTGGSVTTTFSGADSAGDAGGRNVIFSSFIPSSWTALYWGPSSAALPRAALDGSLDTLSTFVGITGGGTVATWQGNTSWTNPGPGATGPHVVPIQMVATITAGGLTWTTSGSVAGLDPGPGTGIAAVIANFPSAVDFTVKVEFLADIPTDGSGYIPLNEVRQGTGSNTLSSFTGAFYSVP